MKEYRINVNNIDETSKQNFSISSILIRSEQLKPDEKEEVIS